MTARLRRKGRPAYATPSSGFVGNAGPKKPVKLPVSGTTSTDKEAPPVKTVST